MAQVKLYKKFYLVVSSNGSQTYNLIDPVSLSANTYVAGTGATESNIIIETSLSISQESIGVYYADLNPFLYASDVTYDLIWFVGYTASSPIKKISTRFRINVNSVSNEIEIEYVNYPLEIEINESPTEIEIS